MTKLAIKTAAIFLYAIVNGTWALIAYLLYRVGVPFPTIGLVLVIGIVLGNLAAYTGVKIQPKFWGDSPGILSDIEIFHRLNPVPQVPRARRASEF